VDRFEITNCDIKAPVILSAIRQLMKAPAPKRERRPNGFTANIGTEK
jgi:hypothetical protein